MSSTGVLHLGLGPIGREVAQLVATIPGLRSVAAVDFDADLAGRPLADVTGTLADAAVVVEVDAAPALARGDADVAVVCTASSLERCFGSIVDCLNSGMHVVSSCEELAFPHDRSPDIARELDEAARENGVAVVGAGVNPGFAMDLLPVVLSGACARVDHVRVLRVQDAGRRRVPLQRKVGAGLTESEFDRLRAAGSVRHVGLEESARFVAAAMGCTFDRVEETLEPVFADRVLTSDLGEIEPGMVAGVRQRAVGYVAGHEVVELELRMAVGLDPFDEIELTGEPPVSLRVPGGLHGDRATAAVLANTIERVRDATPGLRVMSDLAPSRAYLAVPTEPASTVGVAG